MMFFNIIYDMIKGFLDSIRLDILIVKMWLNEKLRRIFTKILKYNILFHIIPFILWKLINTYVYELPGVIFQMIDYLTIIVSTLFHILHYLDLMNLMGTYCPKTISNGSALDLISMAITMSIYQFIIFISTSLIDFIFYHKFKTISFIFNFIVLVIYHSFYCFNGLWQFRKIDMKYRLDIFERLWPYYFGYGIMATIIYAYISNPFVAVLYNLYIALIISLPFLIEIKYPARIMSYPKISLSIFSYLMVNLFNLFHKFSGHNSIRVSHF